MLCRISIDLLDSSDGAGGSAASDGSIDKPESLAIPWTSILQEGSQTYVFVALTDGLIERRRVLLGRRIGGLGIGPASGLIDRLGLASTIANYGLSIINY
jgi:hypothetical protein